MTIRDRKAIRLEGRKIDSNLKSVLEDEQLSVEKYDIMYAICVLNDPNTSSVAEYTGMLCPSISRSIKELKEDYKYIKFIPTIDRRYRRLGLTTRGVNALERIVEVEYRNKIKAV